MLKQTVSEYIRDAMSFYEESLSPRDRLTYREFVAAKKIISVFGDGDTVNDEDRLCVLQLADLFSDFAVTMREAEMPFVAEEIDMLVQKLLNAAKLPEDTK
jgi:hypothetical protein